MVLVVPFEENPAHTHISGNGGIYSLPQASQEVMQAVEPTNSSAVCHVPSYFGMLHEAFEAVKSFRGCVNVPTLSQQPLNFGWPLHEQLQ